MARVRSSTSDNRRSTSTSTFGVGKREGHDASDFYARFSPPELSSDDKIPADPLSRNIDRLFHGNSTDMSGVADGSVALVVTSPPYFAGKAYETELDAEHVPSTYIEYLQMLREVFAECVRKLEPGGRIAINVANLGRRPYRSLAADVTTILQDDLRLLLRGEVIWVKQRGASGSCAWGSFQRATNPVLRDLTERVIIASKGRFDRPLSAVVRKDQALPFESTMSSDEFMDATLDLWEIPPESARRVGHPAPFPVALPQRLINLYTYKGDLVLDPFMGSGTTAVAALSTGRHFVGYDTDAEYVERAQERVDEASKELAASANGSLGPSSMPTVPSDSPEGEDLLDRFLREGTGAKKAVEQMLEEAGFAAFGPIQSGAKVAGIDMAFQVRDSNGRRILIDFSGSFTAARPGLRKLDNLWRTLGRVSSIRAALEPAAGGHADEVDIVLISTDFPPLNSIGGRALRAAVGPGGSVTETVSMDRAGQTILGQLAAGLRPSDQAWSNPAGSGPAGPGSAGGDSRATESA